MLDDRYLAAYAKECTNSSWRLKEEGMVGIMQATGEIFVGSLESAESARVKPVSCCSNSHPESEWDRVPIGVVGTVPSINVAQFYKATIKEENFPGNHLMEGCFYR